MEVVEVNDFPCHSDSEVVVLMDLEKSNDDSSVEVHEVTMDDACGVAGKDDACGAAVKDDACDDTAGKHDSCDGAVKDDTCEATEKNDACDATDKGETFAGDSGKGDESATAATAAAERMVVVESCDDDSSSQDDQMVITETEENLPVNNGVPDSTVADDFIESARQVEVAMVPKEEPVEVKTEVVKSLNETEVTNAADTNVELAVQSVETAVDDTSMIKENSINETNPDGSIVITKDNKTVTIPQHIAGRDLSSLTEETLPRSGKRMLKPRFGVKVPYIHMTSQIVTQDEIAKELFERFQQKYPLTRVEKPDKLFSMKLTHRLANKIVPVKTPDGKSKESIPEKSPRKQSLNTHKKETTKKKTDNVSASISSNSNKAVENNIISIIQNAEIQFSDAISEETIVHVGNSQNIDQITNTLQSLNPDVDQSADQLMNNGTEDKNDEKITSNEELIAILEDFENIETADTNGNMVPGTVPEGIPIPLTPKPVVKRQMGRNNTRTKRSKPKLDPEIEKQIALKQLQEVSRPKRFESHFNKRKLENDKKLLTKNELGSAQKRKKTTPDDVPEVKIAIDHYIKSYTDKRQSTVKMDSTSNDETVSDNVNEVKPEMEVVVEPENKTVDMAKARTMREINRLLGDEGAINMIYSLEKRRSPGNNNAKSILPSPRRMKKDLMLKTKLVKNAMLKMSSPASAAMSTNRLGRRSDVSSPSTTPEAKCTRKTSVDSQDSDQSIKSLVNFPGRKTIPADESKIIRKHSSSSEASSIGGSPILPPVPDAEPVTNPNTKHLPVKTLRVYTRKNKNADDLLLNTSNQSNEVNKGTNKSLAKTKNSSSQKVKKQPVQASTKLSRSLAESIKQEVKNTTYKEITIRRYDGVVHITLTPVSTVMKNALNISVMEELMKELNNLEKDDTCKVVLVSSAGRIFCQGLDIAPLIHENPEKCKKVAVETATTLKNFITCISEFPKLLVAGVDGAAVGLGATMLVHFDLVFASDKATFETPYTQLGHIAEGAATTILGRLLVAEMIMGSQRLTAGQAHYYGLVTRTLWPDRFHDELIPLVKALARQSLQTMQTTKALQKQETKEKLAKALESETHILVQQWTGDECQQNLQAYLKDAVDNINA